VPHAVGTQEPEQQANSRRYHENALIVLAASLLLMRLHGLGRASPEAGGGVSLATEWAGLYGGLAFAASAYFALTWPPGFSPFEAPLPAAWVAVGWAHLLLLLCAQPSPLRSALRRLMGEGGASWEALRRRWCGWLLIGAFVVVVCGLDESCREGYAYAPLLAGAATLALHHGLIARHPVSHGAAALLLALALHADFLLPSHLPREHVVWGVLALWAGLAASAELRPRWLAPAALAAAAALFLAAVVGHVLYHGPWSPVGWAAMALAGALAAATPLEGRGPLAASEGERWPLLLLLWIPWLVYFAAVGWLGGGAASMEHPWAFLAGTAALLAVAAGARACARHGAPLLAWRPARERVAHRLVRLLCEAGGDLHEGLLWVVSAAAALLLLPRHGVLLPSSELLLAALLWGGLAVCWFLQGRDRPSVGRFALAQLALLALLALLRQQLGLRVTWWSAEYDIWGALALSALLTGGKPWMDRQEPCLRRALHGALILLPAATVLGVILLGLRSEVGLVVLGLHAVFFAYLGRAARTSAYHALSVASAVAFVLLLFSAQLELAVAGAYIIPVGLGVLVLLQLFGADLEVATRNAVRFVVLCALLGSSAYHVLLDPRYPAAFHGLLLILGFAAMGCGSLLRVRLYLWLGLAGILLDLGTIFVRSVAGMERTLRMTIVGSLLLLVGVGIVGGSILYQTRREAVERWLAGVRGRLGMWE
jgi:hypothetical protein